MTYGEVTYIVIVFLYGKTSDRRWYKLKKCGRLSIKVVDRKFEKH